MDSPWYLVLLRVFAEAVLTLLVVFVLCGAFAVHAQEPPQGRWTYTQTPTGKVWAYVDRPANIKPVFTPTPDGASGSFSWGGKLDSTQGHVDIDLSTTMSSTHFRLALLRGLRAFARAAGTAGTVIEVAQLLAEFGLDANGDDESIIDGDYTLIADEPFGSPTYWKESGVGNATCFRACLPPGSSTAAWRDGLQATCGGAVSLTSSGTYSAACGCSNNSSCTQDGGGAGVRGCGYSTAACAPALSEGASEADILARRPPQVSDWGVLDQLPPEVSDDFWRESDDIAQSQGGRRTTASGPSESSTTDTTDIPCPSGPDPDCTRTVTRRVPIDYPEPGANGESPGGAPSDVPTTTDHGRYGHVEYGPTTETTDTRPRAGGPSIETGETTGPTDPPGSGSGGSGGETIVPPALPQCEEENPADEWSRFIDELGEAASIDPGTLSPECPQPTFAFVDGATYRFDAHCQIIADWRDVLRAFLGIVWVIVAASIILSA